MRRLFTMLPAAAALALSFGAASAQQSIPLSAAEGGRLWFVELAGAPTADGRARAAVQADKAAFKQAAAQAGVRYTERRSFDTLFNGYSVEVSASERLKLARLPGVKALYPVAVVQAPRPEVVATSAPQLATAIAMTGADIAQNSLGLSGAGVKVAIMDTGVDYHHPDLGGCFGAGCRVTMGWDFVGDDFNANPTSASYNPVPAPDPDPDDCNGHGTHVAGIVGANGAIKGVAPGVTFGAYRVFGCEGSTTADIMLAAMERALADGMHVLNMSIGSAFQTWPQYPTAAGADKLVNKGMIVVASIGNSGASGIYSAGAPGVGKKTIGVASYDNSHVALNQFFVSNGGAPTAIGYANATGAPAAPTSGSLDMARTGTPTTTNDACAALPPGSLAGKAVLIRRGTCTFHIKSLNAQNAGAAAVVLYNNAAGRFSPTVAGTPAITIPVVAVSDAEGVTINNLIAAAPTTLTWSDQTGTFTNPTGGLISSFSSYGLNAELAVKPNIGAPGGLIRSTYPLEAGGYATISGTSMSSPHVAGTVALLLQARGKTNGDTAKALLQNTAEPKNWWGNPALGFLDNVHRQGAGMVRIDKAAQASALVTPSELALGESEAGPQTRTLTIRNTGGSPMTYDLSHVPALSTGPNSFTPAFFAGFAAASFSAPSVSVPAGGVASVDVTLTANAGLADRSLYGGYIVLTPQGGGDTLRVPYAGLKGDYQSIQVIAPAAFGFPWLAKVEGGFLVNKPAGASYSLVEGDVPLFLVHLAHQSRTLRLEAFHATSGKAMGRVSEDDYLPRNPTTNDPANAFFTFSWDGKVTPGKSGKASDVPNGSYVVKMSVLKALGDAANPAHWETWTSPVITIARP